MYLSRGWRSQTSSKVHGLGRLYRDRGLVAPLQGIELVVTDVHLVLDRLAVWKCDLVIGTALSIFTLSNRCNTGAEIDHTVADKDVRRGLLIDRRQDAQMGHHENAVY